MKDIPAFPDFIKDGMTLRDYFAAKAMQGLLNNGMHPNVHHLSADAYRVADAMLEAREA
jgi:hypothetical protein